MAGGHTIEERTGEEGGSISNHGRKPVDRIKLGTYLQQPKG